MELIIITAKKCSTVDWFYNTLEYVFNELHEKNSLDGAYFYMAMRDYVKEIENVGKLSTATIKEG